MRNHTLLIFGLLIGIAVGCNTKQPLDVISMHTNEELSWEEKRGVTLDYIHEGDTLTFPAKAKYRGGFSSGFFKHSFSVEMDKKYPLIGLPSDDDWIFNANFIDKTMMRHKMCYDLYREMSSRNLAPQSAYFHFNLDERYEGLYVLMEKVNAGFVGLNKSDTLAMLFKDPPVFRKDSVVQQQQPENPYEQIYPKLGERNLNHHLDSLQSFLLRAAQAEIEESISEIIDIENVIDWHLLLLFTNNGDGIKKNFYLYKTDSQSPFRIAIWDYDHCFGRDGDNQKNMMEFPLDCSKSILFTRLMEWPDYQEKLATRYNELRSDGIFSVEKIQQLIEENDDIISLEVAKNFERWPINDEWYFDHNTYQQEKDLIVEFVALRLAQLDERFDF